MLHTVPHITLVPQSKGLDKTTELIHHYQHVPVALVARWELTEIRVYHLQYLLDLIQTDRVGKLRQMSLLAGWAPRGARVSPESTTMGQVIGEQTLNDRRGGMTQAVMPLCHGACGEEGCVAHENIWGR